MVMRLQTASGGRRCRCEGEITDLEPAGWQSGGYGRMQDLRVDALAEGDGQGGYQGEMMEAVD